MAGGGATAPVRRLLAARGEGKKRGNQLRMGVRSHRCTKKGKTSRERGQPRVWLTCRPWRVGVVRLGCRGVGDGERRGEASAAQRDARREAVAGAGLGRRVPGRGGEGTGQPGKNNRAVKNGSCGGGGR